MCVENIVGRYVRPRWGRMIFDMWISINIGILRILVFVLFLIPKELNVCRKRDRPECSTPWGSYDNRGLNNYKYLNPSDSVFLGI